MNSDEACFWVRCVAVVAVLLGGLGGSFIGMQKADEVAQSSPTGPGRAPAPVQVIDLGISGYYTVVGAFVGLALVAGPLTLVECRRFAKMREDIAMTTRLKVQQALHEAQTHPHSNP